MFQLRVLDEHEQQAALQLRAQLRGFELPEETSRWLQRRFPRDMRTLYELLDTLDEAALVAQRRLTVPFIREVLGEPRAPTERGAARQRTCQLAPPGPATRRPSACASAFSSSVSAGSRVPPLTCEAP